MTSVTAGLDPDSLFVNSMIQFDFWSKDLIMNMLNNTIKYIHSFIFFGP